MAHKAAELSNIIYKNNLERQEFLSYTSKIKIIVALEL